MPLAPQRIGKRSRLERVFAISLGCVILTFTLCNLKNKPAEPPLSIDAYLEQSRITTSEKLASTDDRSQDDLYLIAQNSTSENAKLNRDMATSEQTETEMIRQHHPDFFLHDVPLENLIRRGNMLTAHTGCSIATWSYNGKRHVSKPLNECRQHARSGEVFRAHVVTPETASQVEPYDSIYVPMVKLEHFVNETLPHIENDFILISGQYYVPEGLEISQRLYDALIEHPRVVRWFLQNLSVYAHDPNHPKLSPFPYGINPLQTGTMLGEVNRSLSVSKDNFIYASHPPKKKNQLELAGCFKIVHRSQYVFAPAADRPETHLHYEAIGAGVMPITSLDPHLYRHLEGNVIFGEHNFNMTELEERLPKNPVVNRRLAFEEYWMEYIEREVGRPMRWWDPSSDERRALEEIVERVNDPLSPVRVKGRREKLAVVDGGTTNLPGTATEEQKTMTLISNGNLHLEVSATELLATGAHYPSYFTEEVPLEKMIARKNLLRVYTGCSIATWSYSGLRGAIFGRDLSLHNDCELDKGRDALMMHQIEPDTASQVQPYDSIYVPIVSLERFVRDILPYIENDFVLMTGQKSLVPAIPRDLYDTIIEHPRVLRWFLQNLSMYAYDAHHPKISPFPYGIYKHVPEYVAEMQRNVTKENFLFVSYLSKKNNYQVRKHIPRSKIKVESPEYFQSMHNSTYVLSPDGDRPECHRHYEAIGMGTMPITALDPFLHRHLLGNAIFGEQRWKLDELETKLPRKPRVNRRLIFEEYWMEYIEREIGRPMRWWDPSRNVRCLLAEITETVKNSPPVGTNTSGALSQSNAAPITQTNSAGAVLPSSTSAIWQPATTASNNLEARLPLSQINATILQPRDAVAVTKKQLRGAMPSKTKHDPDYFFKQVTMDTMVKRMNILTPYTGCSIASFQYNLFQNPHPEFNDCFCHRGKEFGRFRGLRVDNAERLVKDGDVIYVQFNKLEHFVSMTLPNIQHQFVLISGQEQKVKPFSREAFDAVIENPKVIHWFVMNMDIYSYEPHHPKISPWPYGSNPKKLTEFKDELKNPAPEKGNFIYLSGVSRTTNPQRRSIPRGPKVNVKRYLSEMHASKYVLSPDGDRPECYRHYEAIGMGTMPITQLDAHTHSHLEGNALFNNSVWNLTILEATLPQNPRVNQRLIFEEYWMEYVERIVGRPLRWWDPTRNVHASLTEITETVKNSLSVGIAGSPMGKTA